MLPPCYHNFSEFNVHQQLLPNPFKFLRLLFPFVPNNCILHSFITSLSVIAAPRFFVNNKNFMFINDKFLEFVFFTIFVYKLSFVHLLNLECHPNVITEFINFVVLFGSPKIIFYVKTFIPNRSTRCCFLQKTLYLTFSFKNPQI